MDYEELFDLSYTGIMIYPANEDVVIPWDADISIKSESRIREIMSENNWVVS